VRCIAVNRAPKPDYSDDMLPDQLYLGHRRICQNLCTGSLFTLPRGTGDLAWLPYIILAAPFKVDGKSRVKDLLYLRGHLEHAEVKANAIVESVSLE